jgi:O-antigen/teichoic acid export membrane protein
MKINQLISGTIWYGLVPKFSVVITVFILPFTTPFLTASDYGIVGIVNSYYGLFFAIYTLGLNVHLTNSYYEYKNNFNLIWGRILFLLIISGVVSAILMATTLSMALSELPSVSLLTIIGLVSIPLIFGGNALLANHLYPLRSDPKSLVLPTLISNCVGIFSSFILIKYFKAGYIGLLASGPTSSLLTFLFFLKPIWRKERIIPIVDFNLTRIRNFLRISLPVVPHTLGFMLLTASDRLIMGLYDVPINHVGYYTHGYSMGDYVTIISAALITSLAPRIQEHYRSKDYMKLKRVYILSQSFTIVTVFLFSLWIPEIYKVLIHNEDLRKSSSIASIICFANIIYPLYAFMSTSAFIEKKTNKLLYLVFVPGALNVILNLTLIPFFGYKTAIYTTLASYWSLLVIPFVISFYGNFLEKIFESKTVLIVLFFLFSVATLISYFVSLASINIKIITSVIVLILVLYILQRRKHELFDF